MKLLALIIALLASSVAVCQEKPPAWSRTALIYLRKLNLFEPFVGRSGLVETRYQFAVWSHESYASLKRIIEHLETGARDDKEFMSPRSRARRNCRELRL